MDENDEAKTYRNEMYDQYVEQQKSFDQTVIFLSGGALGVTFAFVKDVLGGRPAQWTAVIALAWIAWGLSLGASLVSRYTGARACYAAARDGVAPPSSSIGGRMIRLTEFCNLTAGLLFLIGLLLACIFAWKNI